MRCQTRQSGKTLEHTFASTKNGQSLSCRDGSDQDMGEGHHTGAGAFNTDASRCNILSDCIN